MKILDEERLMLLGEKNGADGYLILQLMVDSSEQLLDVMVAALDRGDVPMLKAAIHDLYGLTTGAGAEEMASLAHELEQHVEDVKDVSFISATLTELRRALERLHAVTAELTCW
jgi:HPt (histidine-containing phosphotransfer) domain-containing protein